MSSTEKGRVCAVILAAGSSVRFGDGDEKIKAEIGGKSVLAHTVAAFDRAESVSSIIIVAKESELDYAREEVKSFGKVNKVISGGACRAESAKIGVQNADGTHVAIHDAARCLITPNMIDTVVEAAVIHGSASLATRVYDTVKTIDNEGKIVATLSRDGLALATTPQVFTKEVYLDALSRCDSLDGITDDNLLLEKAGVGVFAVLSDEPNLKITTKQDLKYCEYILKERALK